jgi:hypothetical protein
MSLRSLLTTVLAIIVTASVAGTILYVRRQPPRAEVSAVPREEGEPGGEPLVKVEDFAPEHYEQGKPAWKVRLANIAVEKGGRTITTGTLREGLIYDKQGRPAVRVAASQITYDTARYDFDVSGGVSVVSPKGAVISTDKLHWDNKSRALLAPGKVTVRIKGATVTTSGLRFDTPKQIVYCPNQVRIDTGRSEGVGRDLVYYLDSEPQRWTLRNAQMVIDVQEAKERTGAR